MSIYIKLKNKIQSNTYCNSFCEKNLSQKNVKYATVSNYYPNLGVHPVIIPNTKTLISNKLKSSEEDEQTLCNNYASLPEM